MNNQTQSSTHTPIIGQGNDLCVNYDTVVTLMLRMQLDNFNPDLTLDWIH